METYNPDELFVIGEILLVLNNSDIVWEKYGTETKVELAERIFKAQREANKAVNERQMHQFMTAPWE